ncbi:uncharacterized protein pcare2 [Paramisgurnus dabryanus]|uniref:uncharacterized protein pcare2 n=1 Tax=Paramisgurnus dabryanus TaxID=90735 RepID=UPI0031F4294B
MGCSPSKGQLFSRKAPATAPQELLSNTPSEQSADKETQENTVPIIGKRSSEDYVVCDAAVRVEEDGPEDDVDVVQKEGSQNEQIAQEGLLGNMKEGKEEIKTTDKQAKLRMQRKQRQRKTSYVQEKAEFILKAHQAAYAYLNPSISRYESLLGLLDQAAQTRLSLQTTVASVVLHYEEINQALEEMVAEGEQMLCEHGHYMASLKHCPPSATKPNNELNVSEVPSELLQQMLLNSTQKMISVGDSVRCLGDSALQELTDYFASLSQLLGDKLQAKHMAEGRLKQILTRVEAAAFIKSNPEDSTLHSEDSGIGAENECQIGSERLRYHRSNSGSGSNVAATVVCTTSSSPDKQFLNGNEEVTDNDDYDYVDDNDDDAEVKDVSVRDERTIDKTRGTIHGSFDANLSHSLVKDGLQFNYQNNSNLKRKTRRPKTADNSSQIKPKHCHLKGPKRSQSTECLCSKTEDFDVNVQQRMNTQTLEGVLKSKSLPRELKSHVHSKIRKPLSEGQNATRYYGLQYGSKGPSRAIPPNSPPKFTPQPPGRNAVKRLINTFSQRVDGNSTQGPLDQKPMKVKSNRKCVLPLLSSSRGVLTTNINTSIYPPEARLTDKVEHVDLDSLPPPPPEMLMENSFERSVGLASEEGTNVSQCRQHHTLLQRETVTPKGANMQQDSMTYLATHSLGQDALVGSCTEQDYKQTVELESAASLKQDFQKVVHLPCLLAESTAKIGLANGSTQRSQPHQKSDDHIEGDHAATLQSKFFPPTTLPVSKTRLPPSCPVVHHAVPSPPSAPFHPMGKWIPSSKPATSSMHSWVMTKENDAQVISSQSVSEARAMFCQDNQSVPYTWTSSCTSTLPRPWGEPARRRLPTACLQPSFIRSSPLSQMSSQSERQQSFPDAKQQPVQGSDVTALTMQELNCVVVIIIIIIIIINLLSSKTVNKAESKATGVIQ